MRRLLRIYRALLKAAWLRALEYRAQMILWILSSIFPLVMMAVWLALVDEAGSIQGWDKTDFISYYVAVTVVRHLTSAWLIWDWDENIRLGNLSFKLLKPVDPLHQLVGQEMLGWKVLVVAVVVPIAAFIALGTSLVSYSADPLHWAAFLVSIVLALLLNIFFYSLFGVFSFWRTQSRNLYILVFGVGQFLSGFIAPLALFPAEFQNVASLLPFRALVGLPVEILMGRLTPSEIGFGLVVTAIWVILFFVGYRILWYRGLRRYEAVGA